jgi:hypothetical protein
VAHGDDGGDVEEGASEAGEGRPVTHACRGVFTDGAPATAKTRAGSTVPRNELDDTGLVEFSWEREGIGLDANDIEGSERQGGREERLKMGSRSDFRCPAIRCVLGLEARKNEDMSAGVLPGSWGI